MIAIIDYGMGNLRSVQKAFEKVGHPATIIDDAAAVAEADRLVLPGVGAFGDAMHELRKRNLADAIVRHIDAGKPFLGICLGLQLLFDVGYEGGRHEGLGVLRGEVVKFDLPPEYKVPHMGWNQLSIRRPAPIFAGVQDETHVYFVHSYHVVPADREVVATETTYGVPFVSTVWRDNLVAVQFHPEKSQSEGLRMLKNFAEWQA